MPKFDVALSREWIETVDAVDARQAEKMARVGEPDVKVLRVEPAFDRDRVRVLRQFISMIPPERFNMRQFFGSGTSSLSAIQLDTLSCEQFAHTCGTVACLGGWTLALFDPEGQIGQMTSWTNRAGELLGLSEEKAQKLFCPIDPSSRIDRPSNYWETLTREDAVRTLDRLLKTGQVDWSK